MNRESILNTIKRNKPLFKELPEIIVENFKKGNDLLESFIKNVEATGGKVVFANNKNDVTLYLKNRFKDFDNIISLSEGIDITTINPDKISSAKELDKLELAILDAQFGVAENGAVWISDKNTYHRSIPFIALHLVLILLDEEIVENMNEAYERLASFNEGYGVFISGPSKTADIEQSLVIGAQGPLSATIILIK